MTLRDIIRTAMRKLGLIQPGEEPTAAQIEAALPVIEEIIESWSNRRLMIHCVQPYYFPTTAGEDTYTLGPGGSWSTERPMKVLKAKWLYDEGSLNSPNQESGV